jgi:hypothetical protein
MQTAHVAGSSRTLARFLVIGAATLVVTFLVVGASRAAFTASTDNPSNQATAAAIDLADNDVGVAMFNAVTDLIPGSPIERCIDVTYTGSIDPTAVQLYRSAAATGSLAGYLDLTVEIGDDTTDAYGDCTNFAPSSTLFTGTVASFSSTHQAYGTGIASWDPSATGTKTFRFTIEVQDDNAAQGLSTTFGFAWETRSS